MDIRLPTPPDHFKPGGVGTDVDDNFKEQGHKDRVLGSPCSYN